MHVEPTLDRGNVDSRPDLRPDFQAPDGAVTHLVDDRGRIAVEGNALVTCQEGGPWLLGETTDGVIHCATLTPTDSRFRTLREVGALLSADESLLAAEAVALAQWHTRDRYCTGCGSAVDIVAGGWETQCPQCGRVEYPRTDPAVIVMVTDPADRVLLAHNMLWDAPLYSFPAGFVEAGESPRRAVMRELREEVSVSVHSVQYLASQPWPAPRSLMLAFRAFTEDTEAIPDGVEIDDARFFTREEYRRAVESGEVLVPGESAIAFSMLEEWLGTPISETCR